MIDLEDAVAPDDKEAARAMVVNGLVRGGLGCLRPDRDSADQRHGHALDGGRCPAVVAGAGEHVDTLMIPKVTGPGDIATVAALLDDLESAHGLSRTIGLEVLIETARGLAYVNSVAGAHPRLEALHFGAGDFGPAWGPAR